jgi:hypothetical protein
VVVDPEPAVLGHQRPRARGQLRPRPHAQRGVDGVEGLFAARRGDHQPLLLQPQGVGAGGHEVDPVALQFGAVFVVQLAADEISPTRSV